MTMLSKDEDSKHRRRKPQEVDGWNQGQALETLQFFLLETDCHIKQ